MIVDNNVIYTPKKTKLLRPLDEIDGFLASNDLTMVRIYTPVPGGDDNIISKTIFLNKDSYNIWMDREISILREKYETLSYKRERFIKGLEIYENHFDNIDLDVDDRDRITKIHNFIVNAEPEKDRLDEFIEESVLEMRSILRQGVPADENSLKNFHRVTNGYFQDPIPEDELTDFILMEDSILTSLDNSILDEDTSVLAPKNKDLEESHFSDRKEKDEFYEKIKAFDVFFGVYRSQKIKRLKKLKNSGFFKDIIKDAVKETKVVPNLKKIIDTVTDKTKVCLTCQRETSSKYCQNIDCESIHSTAYIYSVSGGVELDYLLRFYSRDVSPYRALSVLSNGDKEVSLSKFASDFKSLVNNLLDKREYSLSFLSNRIMAKDGRKIAILNSDRPDIVGKKLNFWECYKSGSKIYGIIQHAEEIKTRDLVSEVKIKMEERRRSFSIDINNEYYKNKVMFVVADYYGQIESCKIGILDTSSSSRVLLKTGLSEISDIIALYPITDMPEIPDIMYVERDKGVADGDDVDRKGRYLMPLLDLDSMTKDQISESSDVYKRKKTEFYRFSGGDIVYGSSGNLYINTDEGSSKLLGEGNIDIIDYLTANEAISHISYVKEQANLYKNYIQGYMFNPNKSSFRFYNNFNEAFKGKYEVFKNLCLKKNGIVNEIFPSVEGVGFYNKKMPITASENDDFSYDAGDFQAYSLSEVTPFMFRELRGLPIVNKVTVTLENTQGPHEESRLNILESPKRSYNNLMSLFIPSKHKIEKDLLNVKQLIYNGIKKSGVEDDITVSMDIVLNKEINTYDLTLFEEYLSENGIYIMKRRDKFSKPIAIKGYDLVSLLL